MWNQPNADRQTCWSVFIVYLAEWTISGAFECGLYPKMWRRMPWMVGKLKLAHVYQSPRLAEAGSSAPYLSSFFVWLFLLLRLTVRLVKSLTNTRVAARVGTTYHKQSCRHSHRVLKSNVVPKMWCFCSISQDRCVFPLGSSSPGLSPDKITIPYVGCSSCEAACVSLGKVSWLWPTCCFLVVL